MPPAWRIVGQCAFTYRVVAEAASRQVPVRVVAVSPRDEADPFPDLDGNHTWMREHRFHYGGWREPLRRLSSTHPFELITSDDLWQSVSTDEVLVVAGLAKKVPQQVLALFGVGALNVHPSLLPDLRGPQPEAEAILRGYRETGVTIHTMTERYDAGPVRFRENYSVGNATVGELEETGAEVAGRGLRHLARIPPDAWPALNPQGPSRYCPAYDLGTLELREDLRIDDVRRRLRLRPEGYAHRDDGAIRVFPIFTSTSECREMRRLRFADGELFVHAWIERTGDRHTWNQCSCSEGQIAEDDWPAHE